MQILLLATADQHPPLRFARSSQARGQHITLRSKRGRCESHIRLSVFNRMICVDIACRRCHGADSCDFCKFESKHLCFTTEARNLKPFSTSCTLPRRSTGCVLVERPFISLRKLTICDYLVTPVLLVGSPWVISGTTFCSMQATLLAHRCQDASYATPGGLGKRRSATTLWPLRCSFV